MKKTLTFEQWVSENTKEFQYISSLLNKKLSDDPVMLSEQLIKCEAWHARINYLLSWSDYYLDKAEMQALNEVNAVKSENPKKMTDLDRGIILRDKCKEERKIRDILRGFSKAIDNRLVLGMSLMKRHYSENKL